MAIGLKHWFGLTALGLVAIAIWRLPPESFSPGQNGAVTHEEARYRALSTELRLADATLKRIRWADSLSALVVATGRDGIAFAVPASIGLTSDEIAQTRLRGEADLDGITRDPNMALGHFYQPASHGSVDRARHETRGRSETYVGTRGGVNYCFRVRVSQDDRVANNLRYDLGLQRTWRSPLGLCTLYAAHGMPGEDITRWLESGGASFGNGQGPRGLSRGPLRGRKGLFGAVALNTRNGVTDDKCMAGLVEACAAIFLDPVLGTPELSGTVLNARRSPAIAIGDVPVLTGESGLLLGHLEEEFGAERFHDFWTSTAPVEEAFESAFGVPVGPWMVSWVATWFRIDPQGPQLAKSTPSAAFLTLGFFLFVTFLRNRRRELG